MEIIDTNYGNYFDPTPRLKSSPVPILFVSFNEDDYKCIYCGDNYTVAVSWQKYCKKCLSNYITQITDNKIYLDVYIFTKSLKCSKHEISEIKVPQNIQECCRNCLEISFFKQILAHGYKVYYNSYKNIIKSEKHCKLCGKSLYQGTDKNIIKRIKLCSDCYLISTERIESTLTKKPILIIYLPWWYTTHKCDACGLRLKFTSDYQKYCENCLIFYTGCRFCLTTNIIFGFANQSQCKKCKRVSSIIDTVIPLSGNSDLDDFLVNIRLDIFSNLQRNEFTDKIKNINKYFCPYNILNFIYRNCNRDCKILMRWIPYSQFTNVEEIARGGFGIIYLATWLSETKETVVLKRYKDSQNISKYFLNELKSNQYCYVIKHHIIRTYGFTKDPKFNDYMLVMEYASGGDLHNWLQKNFTEITWNSQKLSILYQISKGLVTIHKAGFIHRDFHSGNILLKLVYTNTMPQWQWQIGDLGLSQPANSTSSNNEIYGVIPYIAPEIFKGSSFSKKSDIYCMGMVMWEFTTGCKPFADVEHDINLILKILDGKRPEITEDTPECFANLMKRCWDPNPENRPFITEIHGTFSDWCTYGHRNQQFIQAEIKRRELIELKKLGPRKPHPKAIYTSRPLSSLISKCSSNDSSYAIRPLSSFIYKCSSTYSSLKDYTSKELELDIDIESSSNVFGTKRNIEELNINDFNENNSKHVKINSNSSGD